MKSALLDYPGWIILKAGDVEDTALQATESTRGCVLNCPGVAVMGARGDGKTQVDDSKNKR